MHSQTCTDDVAMQPFLHFMHICQADNIEHFVPKLHIIDRIMSMNTAAQLHGVCMTLLSRMNALYSCANPILCAFTNDFL